MRGKFSITEVATLRRELRQSSLDFFQGADIIRTFVAGRGYGISRKNAWDVASRVEGPVANLEFLHRELETLAWVM